MEDCLIPYKDMVMLFSDSACLSKGMVGLLIPYEDKLMLLIYSLFNTFVRGGDGFLIPYEDELM